MLLAASIGIEILLNFIDPVRQIELLKIQVTFEETGEMLGMWLIGWGLVNHREYLIGRGVSEETGSPEPALVPAPRPEPASDPRPGARDRGRAPQTRS